MENKPILYLPYAEITPHKESPYAEEKEIEIKQIYSDGEDCDKNYGDMCQNRHCYYRVLNVKNGEYIRFTCGRRKEEIK